MRHFEFISEEVSVPKLKKEIIDQVKGVNDFALLDRIFQVLSTRDAKGKIEKALATTTKDSNIGHVDAVIDEMISSISAIEGTSTEKVEFVDLLEAGKAVNVTALQQATATFDDIFPTQFTKNFFKSNANFGRGAQMKGPGEFALAIMSPEVTLAAKGDIEIAKSLIEVKAALQAGSGGRLGETGSVNTTKEQIIASLRAVADKNKLTPEQDQFFVEAFESVISKSLTVSVAALHQVYPNNPKAVQESVESVLSLSFDKAMAKAVGAAAARDKTGILAESQYMKNNFRWYQKKTKFDSIMALWFSGEKVYNFKSGDEFAAMRAAGYLGSPSISFIPSKNNEFFAQINFTKKK